MPAVNSMKAKSLMSMSARERWRILAEEINFDRHDGGIEFERIDRLGISQRSKCSIGLAALSRFRFF
jgi:hypothetical protein